MKIRSTIDSIRSDADTRILSVLGQRLRFARRPYANNARLAKGRTEMLRRYVQGLYDFPDTLLVASYEPEDWAGLERFVENSELENRTGILGIIRSGLEPDAKDWKIKVSYPADYAFLLKEVYPGLRHSDYAVTYEVRAYTDVEDIWRVMKSTPQKLSLQEFYLAAQQMEPGSDRYDEIFETAVRMFPADATANLNAANIAMGKKDYEELSVTCPKPAILPKRSMPGAYMPPSPAITIRPEDSSSRPVRKDCPKLRRHCVK